MNSGSGSIPIPWYLELASQGHANQSFLFQCLHLQFRSSSTKDQQMPTSINLYSAGMLTWNLETKERNNLWCLVIGNCQWMAWQLSATCLHLAPSQIIYHYCLLFQSEQTMKEEFGRPNIITEDPIKIWVSGISNRKWDKFILGFPHS